MSEKTEKNSLKKRTDKPAEGRMYAVISPQSITTLAESCGISGLNEEIASKIGEDVTYRLREIVRGCCVHVRNSNERILRSTDVARVLPNCSDMQVYGYLSGGSSEFLYVPDADVFVSEYNEQIVDLHQIAFHKETIVQTRKQFVKGILFLPDSVESASRELGPSTSTSSTECSMNNSITPHLIKYYSTFAKVILCKHGKVLQTVLQNLQTNSKILLIVPYFLNLLIEGLKELPRGCNACENLLLMLRSLIFNPCIYRDAAVVVSGLLTALLMYSVDPFPSKVVSVSKDFEYRELAADTVTMVMEHWYGNDQAMILNILQKMQKILLDPCCSVRSHFGALSVLSSFGEEALNRIIWPYIGKYLDFLCQLPHNIETLELEGGLLKAARHLYPQVFECSEGTPEERNLLMWKVAICDRILYFYFGDSLCAQWRYPLQETLVTENQTSEDNSSTREINTEVEFLPTKKGQKARFSSEGSTQNKQLPNIGHGVSQQTLDSSSKYKSFQQDVPVESVWASSVNESDPKSDVKEGLETVIGGEKLEKPKSEKELYWTRGDMRNSGGDMSEMFRLSSVRKRVKISIRGLPTLKRKLQKIELDSSHKTFIFSYYHKKCLQLHYVGKFTNAHIPVWCINNFTGVLSTCL